MGIHSRSSSCEWIAARCHITSLTTENEKDRLRSTACLMCCGLEVGNQHLMSVSDSKADVYMCLYNSPLGVFYLLYRLLYTVSKRRCSSTEILQESLGLESCFFLFFPICLFDVVPLMAMTFLRRRRQAVNRIESVHTECGLCLPVYLIFSCLHSLPPRLVPLPFPFSSIECDSARKPSPFFFQLHIYI